MLLIAGYIHVDPADGVPFFADLKELAIAARKRPGNCAYDAAMEDLQAGRLLISERWTDQAALSAHLDAAETVSFVTVAGTDAGRYPQVRRFQTNGIGGQLGLAYIATLARE